MRYSRRQMVLMVCCLYITAVSFVGAQESSPSQEGEWVSLFNEASLQGWVQRGGKAKFHVEEASIVGTTVRGEPNSYLCTELEFDNFELMLEFKVDDARINSGIQIRSQSLAEWQNGLVHGNQVEIDPSDRAWTGGIYDEHRRGWLYKPETPSDASRSFRLGQWNRMRILCNGSSTKTWLNDLPVATLEDSLNPKGFVALQLHATSVSRPMTIAWRNIKIRKLP